MFLQGVIQCRPIIDDDIVCIEYSFGNMTPVRATIDQNFIAAITDRDITLMHKYFGIHPSLRSNKTIRFDTLIIINSAKFLPKKVGETTSAVTVRNYKKKIFHEKLL